MMKKIILMLVALMLCLNLLGCGHAADAASLFALRDVKTAEDALYNAMLNRDKDCDLSDFNVRASAFQNDFDLEGFTDANPVIDYIDSIEWYSQNDRVVKVEFKYKPVPKNHQKKLQQAVDKANRAITAMLPKDYAPEELACAISDHLAIACEYAFTRNGRTPDQSKDSAYWALIDGKAVCDGYAGAYQILAQQLGLEVVKVSGMSGPDQESHAWNMVKIAGHWYHVDPTWNDPTPDQRKKAQHDYLLLSDGAMASPRGGGDQYHAAWDRNAPAASDDRFDDAFWQYTDEPIDFKQQRYAERAKQIAETSLEDVLKDAVEHKKEAMIEQFGLSAQQFLDAMEALYPGMGCSYSMTQDGIVVAAKDFEPPKYR